MVWIAALVSSDRIRFMRLFERFSEAKEEGFREEFVKPLLIRMGFYGISNKHGVNEFGKDYVFSELDRFGFFRHLIVQAKHEEKLNQGKKVDDLISQIKQSFYIPYTLPTAPTEQRHVSAVYVFNSGDITDNAETQIRHELPKELASNTRVFSGHHLEILANGIAQRQDESIRDRLIGLSSQLNMNVTIWGNTLRTATGSLENPTWDPRGGILHGIEEFLTSPLLPNQLPYQEMQALWDTGKVFQAMLAKYALTRPSNEQRQNDMKNLEEIGLSGINKAIHMIDRIRTVLQELPPPVI